MRRCVSGAGALAVAWLLSGSIPAHAQASLPMADVEPSSIRDVDEARRALDAAGRARIEHGRLWREREAACYQRVLINACVSQVNADRRLGEQRIRQVEIAANAVIRQAQARERSEAQAERLGQEDDREVQRAGDRERSAKDRDEREAAAARRAREREDQAAERSVREAEAASKRQAREEAAAERQRKASERASQDAANAAAHAAKLRSHEEQMRQRAQRDADRARAADSRPNDGLEPGAGAAAATGAPQGASTMSPRP